MQHKGTVLIETDRLRLRPFTIEDAQATYHNWTSDDAVTKYLTWPTHSNIETTKEIIKMWIDNYQNENFYQWAITLKNKDDEPIGNISVVKINEELNIVQIGYCISRAWWNQRITSEAFSGIIPFLFEQVKVNRIEAQHDSQNPNSGKVMKNCGLKYEGTLRQADSNNQGIVDVAMYSLLKSEYEESI